jgi:hypothetical protein
MRQATPDTTRNARGARGLAILATLILAGFFAAPAQAGGNEFDDGFEDQLGRLVATEVFHLGKWVLTGGPTYVHYAPERYDRHERHHARPRGHAHGHYKHHKRHKRHGYKHIAHRNHYSRRHHGHDHRYGAACNVETHERVRRNRHGEVVEYERHERRGHDRYARR